MRRWIVPLACLAVAVAALVAALLTPRHTVRLNAKKLAVASVLSPKGAGVEWASLDTPGPVATRGIGTYWLAFRAFAIGPSQTLELLASGGAHWTATIGPEPAIHFFGPVDIEGAGAYWLTPARRSATAGERIFYSDFRLFPRPLAALPGSGFWPQEIDMGSGKPINWMNIRGAVDIASKGPIPRVWLSFEVTSVDRPRTLTITEGARKFTVAVPERGATRSVTVGPFKLHAGAGRVLFSSPGATFTARDGRPRTIRIGELEPRTTGPGQ